MILTKFLEIGRHLHSKYLFSTSPLIEGTKQQTPAQKEIQPKKVEKAEMNKDDSISQIINPHQESRDNINDLYQEGNTTKDILGVGAEEVQEQINDKYIGRKALIQKMIFNFESRSGQKYGQLKNGIIDDIIIKKRKETKSSTWEMDQQIINECHRYLEHFSKEMKFWYQAEKADLMMFNVLYLAFYNENVDPLLKKSFFLEKDYRYNQKVYMNKDIASHALQYNGSVIFLNSMAASHLIDMAIMNNALLLPNYSSHRSKTSKFQYGFASDMIDVCLTCHEPTSGHISVSKPLQLYDFKTRSFDKENLKTFLTNLKGIILNY